MMRGLYGSLSIYRAHSCENFSILCVTESIRVIPFSSGIEHRNQTGGEEGEKYLGLYSLYGILIGYCLHLDTVLFWVALLGPTLPLLKLPCGI